ncbi:MAG: tetratricopeptide repeat protein, partial [Actinomycetota bacterium]
RMLLDRGLLVQEDSSFRLTGQIEDLQIPETLHSLVAARLDGLSSEERLLVLDAAVLGKAFFKEGIAALSGKPVEEVQPILEGLVRKEVLTLESEPTSPERGQYSFIHDFVRQIAYGTISKKDRKTKHLAAATFIRDGWQGDLDDVVEVVASHLLQAFELDPNAVDAPTIRQQALEMLRRAAERAASLGANHEAEAYFARAAGFADDDLDRASFIERAGDMALVGGRLEEAKSAFREALEVFESRSEAHAAARVTARLAEIDHAEGDLDEGIERMEKAFSVLSADEPNEDLATLAEQLGRRHLFRGDLELAADRLDRALEIAEAMVLPEVLAQALNTKGILAGVRSRSHEEFALVGYALKVALEHDRTAAALRAYNNLAENRYCADLYEDSLELYREGIALARRVGNRFWLDQLLTEIPIPLFMLGRWDEALETAGERSSRDLVLADTLGQITVLPLIFVHRGELDAAAALLDVYRRYETSADVQERAAWLAGTAVLLNARAEHEQAFSVAEEAVATAPEAGADTVMVKVGLAEGVDAALSLGDLDRGRKILDSAQWLPSIRFTPVLAALVQRSRARIGALEGEDGVEALFGGAAGLFRETGVRFWLATTLTEQAEWLLSQGRTEDAGGLFDEARGIFEALGAVSWLERLERSMAAKGA